MAATLLCLIFAVALWFAFEIYFKPVRRISASLLRALLVLAFVTGAYLDYRSLTNTLHVDLSSPQVQVQRAGEWPR